MLILGIDPGSKWCGYALLLERHEALGLRPANQVQRIHLDFISRGEFESDEMGMTACTATIRVAEQSIGANAHVAIEAISGYAFTAGAGRGKKTGAQAVVRHLLETSRIVGNLEREFRFFEAVDASRTAIQCRKIVVGKGSCRDAAVKVAVERIVNGWPKRSNVHQRDAALCAIAYSFVTRHTRNH